jgi:hypothetical protein
LTIYFYKFKKGKIIDCPKNVRVLKGEYTSSIDLIFNSEILKKDIYSNSQLIVRKRQLIIDFFFKYMRSKDKAVFDIVQNGLNFKN